MSSKSSETQMPEEPKGQLLGVLPFTVGAAVWQESCWASLKPRVKPGLPTPEQDKMQGNPTQSRNTRSHQFLKEE